MVAYVGKKKKNILTTKQTQMNKSSASLSNQRHVTHTHTFKIISEAEFERVLGQQQLMWAVAMLNSESHCY